MTIPWNPRRYGRPACVGPTPRQVEVLAAITKLTAALGYPPSLHELRAELGLNSTHGVLEHLKALERKGYIKRERRVARSLVVLPEPVIGGGQ